MNSKKTVIILAAVLVVLFAAAASVYLLNRPETQKGQKTINVTVVFADKTEKKYEIKTNAEYLADALLDGKIITEKSADGLYTVIAGERADYNLDKSWWRVTKDGEETNVGINEQPVADGDRFEITNTPS
ncbi:MAG: DUF4430 domain-containing protein [Acutalibacteraceae bacterium]